MRIGRVAGSSGPVMAVLDSDGGARPLGASHSTALIEAWLRDGAPPPSADPEVRVEGGLLSPVSDPGKVIAIGLNYVDHAAEVTMALPAEPLVFAKFPSAIVGPDAPIRWSRTLTDAVDYEAELAVVIGAPARNVSVDAALDHVFGYTCLDDVSARDLQFGDGQWVRGKSLDTFCPIGPWIVTADEIPDPGALSIACRIGDEVVQSGTTADMIFGVAELISRLSHSFTLHPGDVIATGTPPGIGWARTPRRLLQDGEVVSVEIDRIGTLSNPIVVED